MKHRIFVPLATGSGSLTEVEATPVGNGQFRLAGRTQPGDSIQFKRGEIVECEIQKLSDGSKGLVAVRSVSSDPEFRKRRTIYALLGGLVGGVVGAAIALWIETSGASAATGFLVGAAAFGFSSARWGDDAWVILSRIIRWM